MNCFVNKPDNTLIVLQSDNELFCKQTRQQINTLIL